MYVGPKTGLAPARVFPLKGPVFHSRMSTLLSVVCVFRGVHSAKHRRSQGGQRGHDPPHF